MDALPIEIEVERLGTCRAKHEIVFHEYHQWTIKYGFTIVKGDYSVDNMTSLNNALLKLKKRFKNIFSNN